MTNNMPIDKIEKIELDTGKFGGFRPGPEKGEMLREHLVMLADGHVSYNTSIFRGRDEAKKEKTCTRNIGAEKANVFFELLRSYLAANEVDYRMTDASTWHLDVTRVNGQKYSFNSNVGVNIVSKGVDLSVWLRRELDLPWFNAFDGDTFLYCGVAYGDSGRLYSYISEDPDIKIGDNVWVRAGKYNLLQDGVVKKLRYYTRENAPYPVWKTKRIESFYPPAEIKIIDKLQPKIDELLQDYGTLYWAADVMEISVDDLKAILQRASR